MRSIVFIAAVVAATPAFALQKPQSVTGGDARQCTVAYDDRQIVELTAAAGEGIAVKFGNSETVVAVNTSDSAHLKYSQAGKDASNIVYFKASTEMPPQPLSVRTIRPDGKPPRDYEFQWTATRDIYSLPPQRVALASAQVEATEVSPEAPKPQTACWQITFTYPRDAAEAQAAAWKAAATKRKSEDAEVALHQRQLMSCMLPQPADPKLMTAAKLNDQYFVPKPNVRYIGMGDDFIAPYAVCDDGMTTIMKFRGNVPTVLGVNPNGTDRQIGFNVEDNGVIRIHEVPQPGVASDGSALPVLRVRAGELVYCIFNRAFAPNDPRSGTSVPTITREVTGG